MIGETLTPHLCSKVGPKNHSIKNEERYKSQPQMCRLSSKTRLAEHRCPERPFMGWVERTLAEGLSWLVQARLPSFRWKEVSRQTVSPLLTTPCIVLSRRLLTQLSLTLHLCFLVKDSGTFFFFFKHHSEKTPASFLLKEAPIAVICKIFSQHRKECDYCNFFLSCNLQIFRISVKGMD